MDKLIPATVKGFAEDGGVIAASCVFFEVLQVNPRDIDMTYIYRGRCVAGRGEYSTVVEVRLVMGCVNRRPWSVKDARRN